ncbi:MAG: hypothetical protein ACYTEL_18820 [Planctomycetota bacterium]|jgi:hypothetical protein
MPEKRDRINIDKKDRALYKKLDGEEMLKFKDSGGSRVRKEQFLFAMSFGFRNGAKRPLESNEGFVLIQNLQPKDEALMIAIAIHDTKSVSVLSDRAEVLRIAEEYAHAGIRLLVDKIESASFGSFEKRFEKDLHEMYEGLNAGA